MLKRWFTILAVLAVMAGACGGDDDDGAPPATDDGTAEVDPEGVVRLGYDLASVAGGGFRWDPAAGTSPGAQELGPEHWVYGALMRRTDSGELIPDLAESVEVVDPNTIEVVMREGLTTSEGTPVDAAMIEAILDANVTKCDPATGRPTTPADRDAFCSLKDVTLTPPNTLTLSIPDGTAASWYDQFIWAQETVPVPPGTDFDSPVGAGPFMITQYVVGQRLVLEKNPEYWDAENIKLAGIELTHLPPDNLQAATAALNAGQIDWARLDIASAPAAQGVEVVTDADPEILNQVLICKSRDPLDDVAVRQALNHAIDREAINAALYNGEGTPAWDLWPEGHPLHNPDTTERYPYDPEQARDLLAEAGVEEVSVDFVPHSTAVTMGQILQQQWGDVGITVNIVPSTNFVQDVFTNKASLTLIPRGGGGRAKVDNFSGSSVGNLCQYADPEIDQLVADLKAVSDSSEEGAQLWHDIQDKWSEDALAVPILFPPRVYGVDTDKLGGYALVPELSVPVPDAWELYVRP